MSPPLCTIPNIKHKANLIAINSQIHPIVFYKMPLISRVGMAGGIFHLLLRFFLIAESRHYFNGNERDHEIDH
jgi:hypothetical protein